MSSVPCTDDLPSARTDGILAPVPLLLLAVLLATMGFVFRESLGAMVKVWNTENYQHGYVIAPMALWLAWRNRREILAQPLTPFWPAVIPLAGVCGIWLVGRLADVNVVQQFAIVGMLPCALALVFGWRFAWSLAYPMAFLLFAVPFGEEFYPVMMQYTADFTVHAVRLSGIPVVQEGLFFQLPSGRWSVVEACSGLRYLLAALPLAALYAYMSWHSWRVRALFIALTAVIAIVANWFRAYLIVMLGHLSGMKLAVGVDHLIYGWIFFGIVMAGIFWLGSCWPDRVPATSGAAAGKPGADRRTAGATAPVLGLGLIAALGIIILSIYGVDRLQDQGTASVRLDVFDSIVDRDRAATGTYRPQYEGGIARIEGSLRPYPEVHFLAVQYLHQDEHGEMITYRNGVNPGRADAGQKWRVAEKAVLDPNGGTATGASLPDDGGTTAMVSFPGGKINEYRIEGPGGIFLVREWFWVNGRIEADHRRVKMATAMDLLRGRGDESLAFVIWTPLDEPLGETRARLDGALARLQAGARAAGL